MKKYSLLLALLLTVCFAFGQTLQDLQSLGNKVLKERIESTPPSAQKINLLLALGRNILFKSGTEKQNIDSAYLIMKQAEKMSSQLKNVTSQGNTLLLAALIANKKGDKNTGLINAQKALFNFSSINNLQDQAEAYIIIGQHYDEVKRMVYYKKAILLFQQTGAKQRLATTLVDLGDLQQYNGDFEASLKNLHRALSLYRSINYKDLINLYNLMGVDLNFMGDPVDGLKYLLLAVRDAENNKDTTLQLSSVYNRVAYSYYLLNDYKTALSYNNKALVVARKNKDADYILNTTISTAKVYTKMHMPQQSINLLNTVHAASSDDTQTINYYNLYIADLIALNHFKQAKIYLDSLPPAAANESEYRAKIFNSFISYFIATRQYKRCYPYLRQIDSIVKKEGDFTLKIYNELAWFKADSGVANYQNAIKHHQNYKNFADSVFTLAKNRQASLLQIEFDTEKKNQSLLLQAKDIQFLKQKADNTANKTRFTQRLYFTIFVALIVIFGIGYNRFRLKQRSNTQLQLQKKEINLQNITLSGLISEKDVLLSTQERLIMDKDLLLIEKDWLLKEIHHRVKNNLQIIMSILNAQSAFLKDKAALSAIKESQNRVQAIAMVHHKLYSNSNFAAIDMVGYINDFTYHLQSGYNTNKKKIRIEKNVADLSLDVSQAVPLGLIINEAITNCIKYAFTGRDSGLISITLSHVDETNIQLIISDNGIGLYEDFNIENVTSMGLKMIKALTGQLKGTFSVTENNGVTVQIKFEEEKKPLDQRAIVQRG